MDQSGPSNDPGPTAPASWASPPPPAPPSAPASTPGKGFDINDFVAFRYLITPAFITVIYIIGAILITLGAIGTIIGGNLIAGLLIFVFANLYWRIVTEFIMVLFRMNDSLQSIDRRGKGM
jgi:hypothetical protein